VVDVRIGNHVTGNTFLRGHRLRLVVMPSFHPHFSANLQTGKSERTSAERRKANITVYFGAERASYVVIPVLLAEQGR
jgi:predicted acyl esterase